jgi:hypothetical protein
MPGEQLQKMIEDAIKAQKGDGKKEYDPFPPKWKPNVGDVLEALIIKQVEVRNRQGGGTRIVRFVSDREGNQFTLPESTGVVRELIRAKAVVGDFLYLKYEGEKMPKEKANPDGSPKSPFKLYTVVVIPADAFAKTGEKFPEPKPVPKPVARPEIPQAPRGTPQQGGSVTQAPTPAATTAPSSGTASASSDDKNVKRLADAVGKISGGMKKEQFEKLYKQVTRDETKTVDDALLDFPTLFQLGQAADGSERVQRVP